MKIQQANQAAYKGIFSELDCVKWIYKMGHLGGHLSSEKNNSCKQRINISFTAETKEGEGDMKHVVFTK